MSELFHGDLCFVHMFACKDENIKGFNLQVYCMSYTNRKTTNDKKNETFPDSEVFICKERLDTQIWLDCICACVLHCFPWWKLSSTSANFAAMTLRALCNSSGCFLFGCIFICVTHFMNSKCRILRLFS